MLKKALIILYAVVVAVMAIATFAEHAGGPRLYGEWWFSGLWALLTAVAIVYFLKQKVRRLFVVVLHLSFVVILAGALLTHVFSRQGAVHLRNGESTSRYMTMDGKLHPLPFTLHLDTFAVVYHQGTTAAADYESHLTLIDGHSHQRSVVVSMNNICSQDGIRLYQSSYDDDGKGTVLSVNSDPWGIPVTYTGYVLLFIALVWMLIDPKGQYRQILRSPLLKKGVLAILLSIVSTYAMAARQADDDLTASSQTLPHALPKETAERFGQLLMLYNNRICPVETYALDFTKKLYGKRHYGNYTSLQVLTGFIFYGDEWSQEPIVRIKSGELKEARQLPDYCSVSQFFTPGVGYVLGPYVQEYYRGGQHDGFHKQVAKIDDQLMMVMDLRQGKPLKFFPYTTSHGTTTWYGPIDAVDTLMVPQDDRKYIREIFTLMNTEVQAGNFKQVDEYLELMSKYQLKNGGESLPSQTVVQAEHAYNAVPFATILFMVNLTLGFLSLGLFIFLMVRKNGGNNSAVGQPETLGLQSTLNAKLESNVLPLLLLLSFLALTYCESLRWIVSGTIPMSNGYETMLLMAWFIELITLLLYRRFPILLTFGFLLSGFFLLVSHISQMDPQIGRMMPVLNSPLLTLHVSIIMMAFALLSLTFICGLTALTLYIIKRSETTAVDALAMLSRVFLFPALTTLGMGIFIGAFWANISWGTYWSWDPKEVWALITLMVYAVPLHSTSLPVFHRPVVYHLYVTLAFLTILMTYFGVNYILGGMHSYA